MTWVGRTWWELQLLPGWEAIDSAECLTITRSADGAFQLSGAVKTASAILMSELEDMRQKEVASHAEHTILNTGQFQGVAASYIEEGTLWKKFWLAHGNLMVYATYNGFPTTWALESTDVMAMLNSIRVISTANVIPA